MGETVWEALCAMRPPFLRLEADLHAMVGEQLAARGILCDHEASLGKGCRIDFLIGNIGVEIKKGKPNAAQLRRQLTRYAQSERIQGLIVICWQSVVLPATLCGKPVSVLSLAKLWGVSLP